jgi:hypothetical protein
MRRYGPEARDVQLTEHAAERVGPRPCRLVDSTLARKRRHVRAARLAEQVVEVVACEILLD